MRRGAKAYFAANLVAQAAGLIRFVLLARFLGAEELGIAAMLLLSAQFFQSVSETGSDRFLVQDDEGDAPRMQGVIQLVLVARGALIALALLIFGGLISRLFNEPELAGSLAGLGLASAIAGFVHLDFRRVQRESDFRPESWSLLISETVGLAATVGAAAITRDHTAVIYGLTARAIALVAVSHITATRPYRWALARREGVRFSHFAMPLFLNGFLLFFGAQGDRLLVGTEFGATALGHYSAVLLLIYYPSAMLTRFLVGISLPPVARARGNPEQFLKATQRLGGRTVLLALAMAAGFTLVAPIFTPIFYGRAFAQPLQIYALIGALQASRFLKSWLNTVANGIGRSTVILFNNVARMSGVAIAWAASQRFEALEAIIIGFLVGEIAALVAALYLLERAKVVAVWRELGRVGAFVGACAAVSATAWGLQAGSTTGALVGVGAILAMGAIVLTSERQVIGEAIEIVGGRLRRLSGR